MLRGTDGAGGAPEAAHAGSGGGAPAGGSLAIDAGQSGIKVRHADAAGASEWAGPGIRTDLPLLPQLARVIEQALEQDRAATIVGL
ncbi:MAG TPA: hypothetical protein VFR16_01620, partial [Agromyces mariniharenae]|nr:hypothetical protein [Agromyces mariniharenae]